ncbi:hypothetical protein PV773_01695 [Mesorhizobium sp. CC13]|uniref:hypothetical protein n=1 Tax=Mesorhizobium sp. CC13 TaxID=3029194 RepID=UPI0032672B9C
MKTLLLIAAVAASWTAGDAMAGQAAMAKAPQALVQAKVLRPGDLVGLSPQPEPPSARKRPLPAGSLVGLNPQPDPPSMGGISPKRR